MIRRFLLIIAVPVLSVLPACQSDCPCGRQPAPDDGTRLAPADVRAEQLRQAMQGLRYDSGLVEVDETVADRGDRTAAEAAYDEGLTLLEENRRVEAIAALTRAVLMLPEEPRFYGGLGQALLRKSKGAEALAAFRTGVELDPMSADLHFWLAEGLNRLGHLDEARAELTRVRELAPDHGEAASRMAILDYYAGDNERAWVNVRAAEAAGYEVPPQFLLLLRGEMPQVVAKGSREAVIGPQVRMDIAGGTAAANETTMASTPVRPLEVVGAWNDWRDSYGTTELVRVGVAVSLDGGETWTDFLVRPPVANRSTVEGDPMTCYDNRTGTLWVGGISFTASAGNSGLFVARQTPGTTSFEPSIMAHTSYSPDKGWMAAGPAPAMQDQTRVYIAYNEGALRSTDMGATWAGPVSLGSGLGFLPRVGPGGELYVSYFDWGYGVKLKRSLNGGVSFTTHTIATRLDTWESYEGGRFPGTFRVPIMHYLAVDPNDGTLYCVYFDTTNIVAGNYNVDLYFSKSTDRGSTWTTPVIISTDGVPPGDQFWPWLEVDQSGRIHMVYYDSRRTLQNDGAVHGYFDACYMTSDDGGATWDNYWLTPAPFDSNDDGLDRPSQFLGDYLGLGLGGDRVYPCYLSTQNGDADIFTNVIVFSSAGDVNGDGAVDNFDIAAFVYAINHSEAEFLDAYPEGCYTCADVNGDGAVDNFDIGPFVSLIAGK
ncbi:MAG: tetratricopeptide repeat protein [Phycisphaerae bacterium]|jgi:Flp pilus assembly protein TadD